MKKAISIIAIAFACLIGIRAQQPRMTEVTGGVFDRTGGWQHKVKIIATDEHGKQWDTMSGTNGAFYILELPYGVYRITASKERFDTFTIPVFSVAKNGQTLHLDIVMLCRTCPELPDLRKELPMPTNAVPTKSPTP